MTIRRITLAATVGACGAVLLAASAHATPPEGDSERTELAQGTTDTPIAIVTDGAPTTLTVQSATLHPGASSGWHTHPGPEYSVVKDGTVVVQTGGDCYWTEFQAGQAVFIPTGVPHLVGNNSADRADIVATYTVPAGSTVRADAPDVCSQ